MNALDAAIYTRLQGTAVTTLLSGTTALYHLQAPDNATHPYIVWNIQGGGPVNLDSNRVDNLVLFIRAYVRGAGSASLAGSIDAQIDTALHLVPLTVSGYTNTWLAREQVLETVTTEPSGEVIHMAGGLYRCRLDVT
jgi:hypothetical protein